MFSFHTNDACAFDSAAVNARASLIQHIGVVHLSQVRHRSGFNRNDMLLLMHSLPTAFNMLYFPQIGQTNDKSIWYLQSVLGTYYKLHCTFTPKLNSASERTDWVFCTTQGIVLLLLSRKRMCSKEGNKIKLLNLKTIPKLQASK